MEANIQLFVDLLSKTLLISLIIFICFLLICLVYYIDYNLRNIRQYKEFVKEKYKILRATLYYKEMNYDMKQNLKKIDSLYKNDDQLFVCYIFNGKTFNVPLHQKTGEIVDKPFSKIIKKLSKQIDLDGKIVNVYLRCDNEVFSPTVFGICLKNSLLDYLSTAFLIATIVGLGIFIVSLGILIKIFI